MPSQAKRALVAVAASNLLMVRAGLAADPPAPAEDVVTAEPDDPEAGTPRKAAPDQRAGHWLLRATGGLAVPFGSLSAGDPTGDHLAFGPSVGGVVGLGISRYVVVELEGSVSLLSAAEACPTCNGKSFDVGLGLAYHLAQGFALDPWASFGVGYRALTLSDVGGTYQGLDWAKLALGADFYPIPSFGFGPFLELDLGTYLDRPGGGDPSIAASFQLGARVAFDPVRLAPPQARSSASAR